jgi:outer membrane protein
LAELLSLLAFLKIVQKRLYKKLISIALGCISFSAVYAQKQDTALVLGQPWSLQQCIAYAWQNNIQVKQAEISQKMAKNTQTGSKANLLPSVSGFADHVYNDGRTIDPFTNTFATSQVLSEDFYVSATFTIFGGFQNINTIKEDKANYKASTYDLQVSKNNIALNIASGYLQVLLDVELLAEAKNQHDVTLQQVEHTQKLVDAGGLARSNLLDVESQEANDEVNEINAQNQLDLANLALAQMLDIDSTQLLKILKPELNIPDNAVLDAPEQVYAKALTTQPDIQSAETKWESAESAKQVAAGAMYPKLQLTGSMGTGYSGSDASTSIILANETIVTNYGPLTLYDQPQESEGPVIPWSKQLSDNFNQSFGLRLNVPIFNGLQSHVAWQNAKLNAQNSFYNYQNAEITLRKNIQQAYADALGALKRYHALQKAEVSLKESYNYTKSKFDVGMATSLDYNTAQTNLAKAESDLLQAKYNFVFKVKVLDFYEGKPLNL